MRRCAHARLAALPRLEEAALAGAASEVGRALLRGHVATSGRQDAAQPVSAVSGKTWILTPRLRTLFKLNHSPELETLTLNFWTLSLLKAAVDHRGRQGQPGEPYQKRWCNLSQQIRGHSSTLECTWVHFGERCLQRPIALSTRLPAQRTRTLPASEPRPPLMSGSSSESFGDECARAPRPSPLHLSNFVPPPRRHVATDPAPPERTPVTGRSEGFRGVPEARIENTRGAQG